MRSALAVCLVVLLLSPAAAQDKAGLQFFEQKIRPVLVEHCYACHSGNGKPAKGGLLVDSRPGLLKGGDSGPAIVPGKPEESPLVQALRHDGLNMPPKQKLPDAIIADFERWVKMGAPDPRDGQVTAKAEIDLDAGRTFWSFRPVRSVAPPSVPGDHWSASGIDRFILSALRAKGLSPTEDADRRTLLRRVTVDLIGLPPTPAEVDAFVNDSRPTEEALATVVDRLLASPAFGERWGRHWLDLARYADSNGKDENLTFYEAWKYRNWVIQAVNRDMPFHQFLTKQLAGDLLPASSQAEADENLTATGFLVVGPKVLADRDTEKRRMDVVDEQLDTVGRVFLGMTLGCARCHDHKFDPIPQADYYALAGIFHSTRTLDGSKLGNAIVSGWMVRPLGGPAAEKLVAAQKEHQKKLTALGNEIKKLKETLKGLEDKATMRSPAKLIGFTVDEAEAKKVGAWKASTFSRPYVGSGYVHDDKSDKGRKSITFTATLPKPGEYEVYISYTAAAGRSKNTPVTIHSLDGEKTVFVDQTKAPTLDGLFASVGKHRFNAGAATVVISNKGTAAGTYVIVDAVRFVPIGALANDPEMAMGIPTEVREKTAVTHEQLRKLEADEKALKASAPPAPQLVMAVRDEQKVGNLRINIRGNPHQLGAEVPRGFLRVVDPRQPQIPSNQSGRRELADFLTDPQNPLTARVFVNRVWMHLFGEGIVRTVDNFGVQGEKPSLPELLDYLAARFVAEGWSLKKLIRELVLTRTYRLSSHAADSLTRADPENRLFGRANRRRVEGEVLRDAILLVSGNLDRTPGESPVAGLGERAIDNDSKGGVATESNVRRSVYLAFIRNDLPPLLEAFDIADPEVATGKRDATTVPTQALYLLNSPFVIEQAKAAGKRFSALPGSDIERIDLLYQTALGRPATAGERTAIRNFLTLAQSKKTPSEQAWASICQALFGSTEFRFVD